MGTRKAATPQLPPAAGDPAAAAAEAGAGEAGSERDCGAPVTALEDADLMGDSIVRDTAAAAAATPAGANDPGVGGVLCGLPIHCGLTGRLPRWLSVALASVERKGPGLMGRLSLTSVRLEAAWRLGAVEVGGFQ